MIVLANLAPVVVFVCAGLTLGCGSGDSKAKSNDAAIQTSPDANCGSQVIDIPVTKDTSPPDLLIVLDRSFSMIIGVNGTNRWEQMTESLIQLTAAYDGEIRFGLTLFPSESDCGISVSPKVPMALDNAEAIAGQLTSDVNIPAGSTPSSLALANALEVFNSEAPQTPKRYVLFATDGMPSCVPEAGTATVNAVADLNMAGIDTFVLGFGNNLTQSTTDALNEVAVAGGQALPGDIKYHQAQDVQGLETVFEAITEAVLIPSCSFELGEVPDDPELVTVSLAGEVVPRDPAHEAGWDYHPNDTTITFFGGSCQQLRDGEGQAEVTVEFGCPGPVIE